MTPLDPTARLRSSLATSAPAAFRRGKRDLRESFDLTRLDELHGWEFAYAALVPAGRNAGLAILLLQRIPRKPAVVAFLASRALDAAEDLGDTPDQRAQNVRMLCKYLTGRSRHRPLMDDLTTSRESEEIDLALAHRAEEIAGLIQSLGRTRRSLVTNYLNELGTAMVNNLERPMPRGEYGAAVLGASVAFACELLIGPKAVDRGLCGATGSLLQFANDLRDGETELYGVWDLDELEVAIVMASPAAVVAALELLQQIGTSSESKRVRMVAMLLALTTAGSFCRKLGFTPPVPHGSEHHAARLAAISPAIYRRLIARLERCADDSGSAFFQKHAPGARIAPPQLFNRLRSPCEPSQVSDDLGRVCGLMTAGAFELTRDFPEHKLEGPLDDEIVANMMISDHWLFQALEQTGLSKADELLGDLDQLGTTLCAVAAREAVRRPTERMMH